MKRLFTIFAVVLVVALIGAGGFAVAVFQGTGEIDDWVVRRLMTMARKTLVPTIEFETFDISANGAITLDDVVMTAPDGTQVASATSMLITFSEPPQRGRPLRIESITLQDAEVRLIEEKTNDKRGLKGLVPIVRREVESSGRLSDALRIRELAIEGGTVIFDPNDGRPPMTLDDLSLALDIEPPGYDEEKGWYSMRTSINRAPIFTMDLDGRMNLDTFEVDVAMAQLDMELREESYKALPPSVQQMLRHHEASGGLSLSLEGTIPIADWRQSTFDVRADLDDVQFRVGRRRFPIESGAMRITASERRINLTAIDMKMAQGTLSVEARTDLLEDSLPFSADVTALDVDLEDLLMITVASDTPSNLIGVVDCKGMFAMDLLRPSTTLYGEGETSIFQGNLVEIPLIESLADAYEITEEERRALRDQIDALFSFTNEAFEIQRCTVISPRVVARGRGFIYYDGRLDLAVNGGPIEKLQASMGGVGDVLAGVTDGAMKYYVSGTYNDPTVTLSPFGIGAEPGRDRAVGEDALDLYID